LAARLIVGVGALVAVAVTVGAGPFLHGLLSIDGRTVGAAVLLAAIATSAAAWRWRVVAVRLGVTIRWSTAIGMYYRSQFLNTVLPGGIVGDIHRALAHGRRVENIRQTARAVVIERTSGQIVQGALTVLILACFGAQFEGYLLTPLVIGLGTIGGGVLIAAVASVAVREKLLREGRELRASLGSAGAPFPVVIASIIVIACHVATFTLATAAVGIRVPPTQMLTLAIVILFGASIPLNVGGWGPREGIAGWAFALGGFGASGGVAASTLFGVLTVIAVSPGAIIALVFAIRGRRAKDTAQRTAPEREPVSFSPHRVRRTHRARQPVCHSEQRHLARRVSRYRGTAATHPLE
jgi:uncharacterized membrane protein YbhN (UPF0104 family)